MATNEMTLKQVEKITEYLIDNNKNLYDAGMTPVAVGVEGEAGIGKTSMLESLAAKKGMTFVQLNLAQLEEVGDLTGMPLKEFWCEAKNANGEIVGKWVAEGILSKLPATVRVTGKHRTGYATPAWLPTEENPNGTILLLDDYTRANSLFMQATMELINKGKYVSWDLPKYTTILLSTNPDDNEYSVSSLDDAQKTRFCSFSAKFDYNDWAEWAESAGIDGRCINFVLAQGDELFKRYNGVQIANARSFTTFCKCVSGIKDWEDPNALLTMSNIAKGCFMNDKDNVIGRLFAMFINNKLDKLIQPKDLLCQKFDVVKQKIKECVYDKNGNYRAEIGSILATRLLNYSLHYFTTEGAKEAVVTDRLKELVNCNETLLSEDSLFYVINNLLSKDKRHTTSLLIDPKIRQKAMI